MNVIQYLKDKFNPARPMGRKNFFWSSLVFRIVVIILSVLYLFGPGDGAVLPIPIGLVIQLVSTPYTLLALRRARAANVHFSLICIGWLLSIFNSVTSISFVTNTVFGFNVGLFVALVAMKNKVEPVSP